MRRKATRHVWVEGDNPGTQIFDVDPAHDYGDMEIDVSGLEVVVEVSEPAIGRVMTPTEEISPQLLKALREASRL